MKRIAILALLLAAALLVSAAPAFAAESTPAPGATVTIKGRAPVTAMNGYSH